MMMLRFDSKKFSEAMKAEIKARGYGARQRLLRDSGIATASLQRMITGDSRDIDNILSVSACLNLSLEDFLVDTRQRAKDYIRV